MELTSPREMERFKSSFKTLQEAITSIKLKVPPSHSSAPKLNPPCSASPSSDRAEPDRNDHGGRPNSRFFFSPCTTKSIMEEHRHSKLETGKAAEEASSSAALCEESTTTMAVSSADPYHDFRASMEEMVAAYRMRDWHSLEELLHCYLRLNERRHHKFIVLAFVDLLMRLLEQDKESIISKS